jgi:hypothetical protein
MVSATTIIADSINSNKVTQSAINPKAVLPNINIFTSGEISIVDKPLAIYSQEYNTAFVLDNDTNGIIGSNYTLGSEGMGSIIPAIIVSNSNKFVENWDFTDFVDAANTTATVSTTNRQVTFTSGQKITTNTIYVDSAATTYVGNARVSVTVVSGSVLIEVSSDYGTHWTTVPNGSGVMPSYAGNSLQLRITENAGSTATISLVEVIYSFIPRTYHLL